MKANLGGSIAEGSQVRASYRPVDGKLTALRLDVTPGAKKADDKK